MATRVSRSCVAILVSTGTRCGKPATVLDHVRSGDRWPPAYICAECAQRDYPNQFTPPPEQPSLFGEGSFGHTIPGEVRGDAPAEHPRRWPLDEAQRLADEVQELLAPFVERHEIAGSIRRRSGTVGSIEYVAVPIKEQSNDPNLAAVDQLDLGIRSLKEAGTFTDRLDVRGRPSFGPVYKRLLYKDVPLDCYSVTATSWGLELALRTGPASFSKKLVTSRRRGGLLPEYLMVRGHVLWRTKDRRSLPAKSLTRKAVPDAEMELVPVPDEDALFHLLAMNYLEPERRR